MPKNFRFDCRAGKLLRHPPFAACAGEKWEKRWVAQVLTHPTTDTTAGTRLRPLGSVRIRRFDYSSASP